MAFAYEIIPFHAKKCALAERSYKRSNADSSRLVGLGESLASFSSSAAPFSNGVHRVKTKNETKKMRGPFNENLLLNSKKTSETVVLLRRGPETCSSQANARTNTVPKYNKKSIE